MALAADNRPQRPLLGRGVWALGDQALLSVGNFLTNILLIRHLTRDRFGDFAVLFSVILFLNNLHSSLVIYPLTVCGANCEPADFRRRVLNSLRMTLALAIPFGAILALVGGILGGVNLIPWLLAALIFWQLQETLRRAMMARLEHHRAVAGDSLSYLGQVLAIWILIAQGSLSIEHAFGVIAATSAAAAIVQAVQLKLFRFDHTRPRRGLEQLAEHWSLGRWVLLSNLVGLITVYATPWLLRYFHGAGDVAAYQALSNLLGVSNPIVMGMAGLIVPAVAKAARMDTSPSSLSPGTPGQGRAGGQRAAGVAVRYALQGLVVLLPYYVLLLLLPQLVMRLFYGSASPYLIYTAPLRLMVGVYALYYVGQMFAGFFNGLGRGELSFYAQSASAVANAAVCLPLAISVGFIGAIWGGIVPMIAQVAVSIYLLRRLRPLRRSQQSDGPVEALVEAA